MFKHGKSLSYVPRHGKSVSDKDRSNQLLNQWADPQPGQEYPGDFPGASEQEAAASRRSWNVIT